MLKHRAPILALLLLAAVLTAVGASLAAPAAGPVRRAASRPNIVVILTDDQDLLLGSMNYMPRTRELIGAKGATFSNFFVPQSLCCPSRATLLTGLYTHNHGIYTNFRPAGGFSRFTELGHEEKTLAVALDEAGYRTALFGKYMNEYPYGVDPAYIPPGWDEWIVPAAGGAYAGLDYTLNHNGTLVAHGSEPEDYLTDVLAGEARDFVARSGKSGEPFFLLLAPFAPHKPSFPAKRHAKLFPGLQAPRTKSFNERDMSDKPQALQRPPLTRREIDNQDILYRLRARTLQSVDEMVAGLVEALRKSGQLGNTYLFFTSDNGYHLGQHRLLAGKHTPYEEDIRVPLLVRGPGIRSRLRIDHLAVSVDLAPTIAELAGISLPVPPDGRSLVRLLRGVRKPAGWRRSVLIEQFAFREEPQGFSTVLEPSESDAPQEHATLAGLRTATWKYIEHATGEREYYDLSHDPQELSNRASEMDPAYLEKLSAMVQALSTCAGAECRQAERTPPP